MKALKPLSQYLHFINQIQKQLNMAQNKFKQTCKYTNQMFKILDQEKKGYITKKDFYQFINLFSYNLYQPEIAGSNYKIIKKQSSKQQLLEHAIDLLFQEYTNEQTKFNLNNFNNLAAGYNQKVAYGTQLIQFKQKQAFFNLLITQIQNLLNNESFKIIVKEEISKFQDKVRDVLTEDNNEITSQKILVLMHTNGNFIKSQQIINIITRIGKIDKKQSIEIFKFLKYFTYQKKQQFKVFCSSKKKSIVQRESKFFQQTPNSKKKVLVTAETSNRKVPLVLSQIKVNQFSEASVNIQQSSIYQTLIKIANIQKDFQRKKQKLILDSDLDFQQVYEQFIDELNDTLIKKFGDNTFTSFLRFLLPTTSQHKSLGFIRHNIDSNLKQSTIEKFRNFIQEFENKQNKICQIWQDLQNNGLGKQKLFSLISSNCKVITKQDLLKKIDKKGVALLLQRMDKKMLGKFQLENFN